MVAMRVMPSMASSTASRIDVAVSSRSPASGASVRRRRTEGSA